jgi:serine kinase of HPr protein (carbohydrate metabolism regulator)
VLKDVPFIIIAGGRRPAEDLIERCKEEDLTLASSSLSVYEICGRLYEMGLRAL